MLPDTYASEWITLICENGCSVCMYVIICVFETKFVFHAAACVSVSIFIGAAKYSHHSHFYSPSLELCVL